MSSAFRASRLSGRFAMAVALALSLLAPQAHGQQRAAVASSPFSGLSGTWAGTGTVTLGNGEEERIRCRARYVVEAGGNALRQSLRCASASYNFDLSSDVFSRGGTISGQWSEATRNTGGSVSGSVLGDGRIQAVVSGAGFSAAISVTTRGNRQSVQLSSQGQEVTRVSISLRRA